MNITIWSRSRRKLVVRVQVWVIWVRILCRVWILVRVGLRTYEAKSDVAALAYSSRLRGVSALRK